MCNSPFFYPGNGLEGDSLGRALANAGTALDAVCLIDLGSTVSNGDSTHGAGTDAALATDALLFVNFSSHFSSPLMVELDII